MSAQSDAIVGLMIDRWLDDSGTFDLMDSCELVELLVKHGLADKVAYDPDKHGGCSDGAEPGDDWYALTEAGKSVLAVHRP